MKRIIALCLAVMMLLCSCSFVSNMGTKRIPQQKADKSIVGKWIDVVTEQVVEFTDDGYYCEYINQSLGNDRTRYLTQNDRIYYYLDGEEPDMDMGIEYEIKDGRLIIAGVLEYKPMDIKAE